MAVGGIRLYADPLRQHVPEEHPHHDRPSIQLLILTSAASQQELLESRLPPLFRGAATGAAINLREHRLSHVIAFSCGLVVLKIHHAGDRSAQSSITILYN